jgi:ATP-dependent DNA helicase RecG
MYNLAYHRDYTVIGSEVHVDMYDDRLEIYSPGGMPDGTLIQKRDVYRVPSKRRNPVIAEIFHRLDFIERRGSGLKKIRDATANLYGYTDDFAPEFRSTATEFHVILKNMNYDLRTDLRSASTQVSTQDEQDGRLTSLLEFCAVPRTREEMQRYYGIATREYFRKNILKPLLDSGKLTMTIPDKPNSRNQRYVTVLNHRGERNEND